MCAWSRFAIEAAYRLLMGTVVVGVMGLSLLGIVVAAGLRLMRRRSVRGGGADAPADRYLREMREIQRITHARSERRYTGQVGDPPAGNYGSGSGV